MLLIVLTCMQESFCASVKIRRLEVSANFQACFSTFKHFPFVYVTSHHLINCFTEASCDPLHTYLSLCGFSIAGDQGTCYEQLADMLKVLQSTCLNSIAH